MKKLIIFLLLIASSFVGGKAFFIANKADKEYQSVLWALYHEKNDRYDDVVADAITTLEKRLETTEKKSGKTLTIIEEKQTPVVFRYRLGRPVYREDREQLLSDINDTLDRVILFDHVIDAQPTASSQELVFQFSVVRYRDTEENRKTLVAANEDYRTIVAAQKVAINKIDNLTSADVPKYRLAGSKHTKK